MGLGVQGCLVPPAGVEPASAVLETAAAGHWTEPAVRALHAAGSPLIRATAGQQFCPDDPVTGREWVAALAHALGVLHDAANTEAQGIIWSAAALRLSRMAIIDYPLAVAPGLPVRRAQAFAMLYRSLPWAPDPASGADPAGVLMRAGVVTGAPGRSLEADRPLTRAEAAVLLVRLIRVWGAADDSQSGGAAGEPEAGLHG